MKIKIIFGLLIMNNTFAKDFGTQSSTWIIEEENFVNMIKRRMSNIDINQANEKLKQKAEYYVNNPKGNKNIDISKENRSYTIDPSYVLESDIIVDGKILYAKSHTVNPLEHISLNKKLVFLNSNNKESLMWAKQLNFDFDVVLIDGDIRTAKEILEREIYFDQMSEFTKKFKIRHVPAILEQEAMMIKINEVKVE